MVERRRILVDSGAIVAALDSRDQFHAASAPKFRGLPKPFHTCEAVISEACFLLGESATALDGLLGMIVDSVIVLDFSLAEHSGEVRSLMGKYSDIPMSLADACLVRMSEIGKDSVIFTYDNDFSIYRRNGKEIIATLG